MAEEYFIFISFVSELVNFGKIKQFLFIKVYNVFQYQKTQIYRCM